MRLFQNPIHIIILFGTLILLINLNNPCFALESNSYEVILKKGWNLIALPLTPTDNWGIGSIRGKIYGLESNLSSKA